MLLFRFPTEDKKLPHSSSPSTPTLVVKAAGQDGRQIGGTNDGENVIDGTVRGKNDNVGASGSAPPLNSCRSVGWPKKPWAPSQKTPSEVNTFMDSTFAVWSVPTPLTSSALEQLIDKERKSQGKLTLLCGFFECLEDSFLPQSIVVEKLNLRQECQDTPVELLINQHHYHKLMTGTNWPAIVQSLASLCVLHKRGGTVMNLLVKSSGPEPIIDASWIPSSGDIHKGASLPSHSPIVWDAMVSIMNKYPCYNNYHADALSNTTWPIIFDFDNAVRKAVTKAVNRTSSSLEQVSMEYYSERLPTLLTDHFGTITIDGNSNLGDQTQGFAGIQFTPYINGFVDRSFLTPGKEFINVSPVPDGKKMTVFVNAWYGEKPQRWPPAQVLDPLLLSLHFESNFVRNVITSEDSMKYYETSEPLGARDTDTLNFLQSKGIPSYFSGCFTLMLRNPFPSWLPREEHILVVDANETALQHVLPARLLNSNQLVYLEQRRSGRCKLGPSSRLCMFDLSFRLLMQYARAKLVVTSRIHTALPSVAMDTPVVFISSEKLPGGGGNRTAGLLDLFHTVAVSDSGEVKGLDNFDFHDPPPNPSNHQRDRLRSSFWNVIRRRKKLKNNAELFGMVPFPMFDDPRLPPPRIVHMFHNTGTKFDFRRRRSIESVLYHHPNAKIILYTVDKSAVASIEPLTESGYDVTSASMPNLQELLTSISSMQNSQISSDLITAFLSRGQRIDLELIKLALLYRDGGMYIDSDIILLTQLDKSFNNVLVAGEGSMISDMVMAFEKNNQFIGNCIIGYLSGKVSSFDELEQVVAEFSSFNDHKDEHFRILQRSSFAPVAKVNAEHVLFHGNKQNDTQSLEISKRLKEPSSLGVKLFYEEQQSDFGFVRKNTIAKELFSTYCVLCSDVI